MVKSGAYDNARDADIAAGCAAGDQAAFDALFARYDRTLALVSARALDEVYPGDYHALEGVLKAVHRALLANDAAPLRVYAGRSLETFLVAVARRVTHETLRPTTTAPLLAEAITPSGLHMLDDDGDDATLIGRTLERLPADATAVIRMRARGLGRRVIAEALSRTEQSVHDELEQLAQHLSLGLQNAHQAWRVLLDAASLPKRTTLALRTRDDERYHRDRSEAERVFRELGEHVLLNPARRLATCIDHHQLARLRDGSLAADDREFVEGHVTGCAHCTDALANLTLDLRAASHLRHWQEHPPRLALSAALIASTRYLIGQRMAEEVGGEVADLLQRVARVGRHMTSGRSEKRPSTIPPPPMAQSHATPSDLEAPVVALEEIARGRAPIAYTMIDDLVAKTALGRRIRMLACAAGHDPELGRALAFDHQERPYVDPGLEEDCKAVLALPEDVVLPREIVRERVVTLIPDLVRYVMAAAE